MVSIYFCVISASSPTHSSQPTRSYFPAHWQWWIEKPDPSSPCPGAGVTFGSSLGKKLDLCLGATSSFQGRAQSAGSPFWHSHALILASPPHLHTWQCPWLCALLSLSSDILHSKPFLPPSSYPAPPAQNSLEQTVWTVCLSVCKYKYFYKELSAYSGLSPPLFPTPFSLFWHFLCTRDNSFTALLLSAEIPMAFRFCH